MPAITPNSDVILLKVPLEIDEKNQLTFANATAQYNYFYNLTGKLSFDKFTYQRKDGVLRIPALMDDIINYNYVMYRNTNYSNKWFYAFIESMEYVNDNVTAVKIRTDIWQTWQFDLTFKPTFIEREHTNNDTIGSNVQPESLETGEPVINGQVISSGPAQGFYITFLVSDTTLLPDDMHNIQQQYYGIFSGYTMFAAKDLATAKSVITNYVGPTSDSQGNPYPSFADAIKSIFLTPKELFGTPVAHSSERFGSNNILTPSQQLVPTVIDNDKQIPVPLTVDGYTPKNNKLFTWPFSYLLVSNNIGADAEYRYEDFENHLPRFNLSGIISCGCDIKLYPTHYKNYSADNQIYGLKMAKLPVCSWNTDSYAIWQAQNALNMRVSLTRNTIKTGLGALTHNWETAASGVGSYFGDVLNSMSERFLARHAPDEVHGDINSSDFNFADDLFIEYRKMSVRAEYARKIDNFFSMFGYATNDVKLPNVTGRTNWNFVKTADCYIEADIPQEDLQGIKDMFNRGVTFWHNPSTFADYSQSNAIVS